MDDETVWKAADGAFGSSNAGRLARRLGVAGGHDELHAASVADLGRFWDAVVAGSRAAVRRAVRAGARRVGGARVAEVVRRWSAQPGARLRRALRRRPRARGRDAVVWEGEEGVDPKLDVRRARAARPPVSRRASHDLGVRQGDAVALLLPMVPEAAAALYAVASLGALAVPIFSGFSAPAVASRLIDSGATVLITCDAFPRRGRPVPAKETADRAAAEAPALRHVVVLRRLGVDVPWQEGRDVWYHDLVADRPGVRRATPVDSEHPVLLGYTSGTTGRPKGAVHVHGGLLVKFASETAYIGDLGPDDRVHWATDLGWIMGPWLLIGTHALGEAASCCSTARPTSPIPAGSGGSSQTTG